MEYTLVVSGSRAYIEKRVSELLKDDWLPLGGIAIADVDGEVSLAQALVKIDGAEESGEWQKRYSA